MSLFSLEGVVIALALAAAFISFFMPAIQKMLLQAILILIGVIVVYASGVEQVAIICVLIVSMFNLQEFKSKDGRLSFNLLLHTFWFLVAAMANHSLALLFAIFMLVLNAYFYQHIVSKEKERHQRSIFNICFTAGLIFVFYYFYFGADSLIQGFSEPVLGASTVVTILLAWFFTTYHLLPNKDDADLCYHFLNSTIFSSLLLICLTSFGLFTSDFFRDPYLSQYIMWLVYIAGFLHLGFAFIYGGTRVKVERLYSFLLLYALGIIMFQKSTAFVSTYPLYFAVVIYGTLVRRIFSNPDKATTKSGAFLFLFATLFLFSPLNRLFTEAVYNMLNLKDFWSLRFEFMFFPAFLYLVPAIFAGVFALVLGKSWFSKFSLSEIKSMTKINLSGLLFLFLLVLGIYPLPLYIYMQFIFSR